MNYEEALKQIKDELKGDITGIFERAPKRAYIDIDPDSIVKAASFVFKDLGARFNIASGVDLRECMEILYHFTIDEINLVISFRVKLSKDKLEIDSLVPVFEGANWIEREIHEMLGIRFKGHPNLTKLLLPDEWPEGSYPLRADYEEWDDKAIRDRGI